MAQPRLTPLDLYVEVTDHSGARYKWGANQAPGSRLRNFSFRTKIGEGFSDANGQLARRIDLDYPDLNLVYDIRAVGADGSVAYEGRLEAMPRELSDSHSIGVTLAGWMAHAKDRRFREIYGDRSADNWTEPDVARRYAIVTGGGSLGKIPATAGGGGLTWELPNESIPASEHSELHYDAGPGLQAAKFAYRGKRNGAFTGFEAPLLLNGTGGGITSLTLDDTLRLASGFASQTLALRVYNSSGGTVTPAVGHVQAYTKLAVYGNHGLTLHTGEPGEPDGVFASDVMRDIAGRYCPMLNTDGVEDTDYVIQHLAFPEATFPYDAFLELNKYHLWHLGVWENRTLTFRPYDLTDYQWEIRTDDVGTTFDLVGPTTESLFNGIVVTYADVLTGIRNILSPDDYADLQDLSTENPWNQAGIDHWDEITLSTPTVAAQALQIGRAALAERNRPKTAGTLTVRGYIRDRAGNPQPVWKVRAGDVICITSLNEINRLIIETDYDDESKTIRIAVDFPFQTLEAMTDRIVNALQARGLA